MISYSIFPSMICAPYFLFCPLRPLVSRCASLSKVNKLTMSANMDDQSYKALENLRKERPGLRLLSIQSHVVSGYVGNKCSVFILQLHGFEVDSVNSVQFSNHTGYEKGIRGNRLTVKDLDTLYEGLKVNKINNYSHLLTGYCGDASFLRGISSIVKDIKSQNSSLIYVCDPVLGDHDEYYVPEELTDIYRDEILPLADIITPNAFELSKLTKLDVKTEADCLKAIKKLHHNSGVRVIIVTSGIFAEKCSNVFYCYASEITLNRDVEQHRFEIPVVKGHFVGTGDVFTSLLVVWLTEFNGSIKDAICSVISSMQAVLKRTSAAAFGNCTVEGFQPEASQKELHLIQSRQDILAPQGTVNFTKLE